MTWIILLALIGRARPAHYLTDFLSSWIIQVVQQKRKRILSRTSYVGLMVFFPISYLAVNKTQTQYNILRGYYLSQDMIPVYL